MEYRRGAASAAAIELICVSPVMTVYRINEFTVSTSLPFVPSPPKQDANLSRAIAEVEVLRGSLKRYTALQRRIRRKLLFDVGDGFLIQASASITLHVDLTGKRITVDAPDAEIGHAVKWVIHAGLGAATLLHGGLPLHASGVRIADKYIALQSYSGAGKSTFILHLIGQGAQFANDDLISIRLDGNTAHAYPAVSLYPEVSRSVLDRYLGGLYADPSDAQNWLAAATDERRAISPEPLAAVFQLRPDFYPEDRISGSKLQDLIKVSRLSISDSEHMFATQFHAEPLVSLGIDRSRFNDLVTALACQIPVFQLSYPRVLEVFDPLGEAITNTLLTIT